MTNEETKNRIDKGLLGRTYVAWIILVLSISIFAFVLYAGNYSIFSLIFTFASGMGFAYFILEGIINNMYLTLYGYSELVNSYIQNDMQVLAKEKKI